MYMLITTSMWNIKIMFFPHGYLIDVENWNAYFDITGKYLMSYLRDVWIISWIDLINMLIRSIMQI